MVFYNTITAQEKGSKGDPDQSLIQWISEDMEEYHKS